MSGTSSAFFTRRTMLASTATGAGVGLVGVVQAQDLPQAAAATDILRMGAPGTRSMARTILVGAGQKASGDGAGVISTGDPIARLAGEGAMLRDIALVGGPVAPQNEAIGVGIANTRGSSLREVSVDLRASVGKGRPAFNLTGDIVDHMSMAVWGNTPGYTYITNEGDHSTNTMDGHVLIGFNLVSGEDDAIEYNNPGTPMKHNVTWGGILDAGRNGRGPTAGFALGVAHNQGWVAGGFVSRYARTAGVHLEDGNAFGVLSSIALRGCQKDGIWAATNGFGRHGGEATPIVITGFSAEGPGKATPGTQGVWLVYDPGGYTNRWPVVGGYVKDFSVGLFLDGIGTVPATWVTVDDCDTVLKTTSARHYGTLFAKGASTLFAVTGGGARGGTFVQTDRAPDAIIGAMGGAGHVPRNTVDGFAFPALAGNRGGNGATIPAAGAALDLFQAPVRMRGRLRIALARQGSGLFWEGEVSCLDGRTIGVLDEPLYEASGVVAISSGPVASFTGSIAGNRLDVSAVASGGLTAGQTLFGGVAGTRILRQLAGSPGGAGSYLVDVVQTLPSAPLSCRSPLAIVDGKVQVQLHNGGQGPLSGVNVTIEFDGTFYG